MLQVITPVNEDCTNGEEVLYNTEDEQIGDLINDAHYCLQTIYSGENDENVFVVRDQARLPVTKQTVTDLPGSDSTCKKVGPLECYREYYLPLSYDL